MLPERYKPKGEGPQRESREEYFKRLDINTYEPEGYFYSHVVYDHFRHFNSRFPWFNADTFKFCFENWTAKEIQSEIKYDRCEEMEDYYFQVDNNAPEWLLDYMKAHSTWPIPIVIFKFREEELDSVRQMEGGKRVCKVHLIEGCRRISFLKKFLLNGWIQKDSKHKILVLRMR